MSDRYPVPPAEPEPRIDPVTGRPYEIEGAPPPTQVNVFPKDYVTARGAVTAEEVAADRRARRHWRERRQMGKAMDVIWYFIGVLEVLLALRFILEATGAQPASGF